MPYEVIHFRGSDEVIEEKGMVKEVKRMLEYLDSALCGAFPFQTALKQAMRDYGWGDNLGILPDRRYQYKGFKGGLAVEGNLSVYEFLHEGLFRLQIGHDKGKVDAGIILVNTLRSEKSPYEGTRSLVEAEIEMLEPTISMPITVALFELV